MSDHKSADLICPVLPDAETLIADNGYVEYMFAKLKDRRRISMRYDRCAHTFFSAICIAATVTFWLGQ